MNGVSAQAALWSQVLAFMLTLFVMLPARSDYAIAIKIILVMATTGAALKIVSVGLLTDWATKAGHEVAAPSICGSLVFVGFNFAVKKADIPLLPEKWEKVLRYIVYAIGGVLMAGSAEWGKLFYDVIGLIAGGKDTGGLIGIVEDLLRLLTFGLRGQ